MTQTLTNTEILLFVSGYQHGTVDQVSKLLGCTANEIVNAGYAEMQKLIQQAQKYRNGQLLREQDVLIPLHPFQEIKTI